VDDTSSPNFHETMGNESSRAVMSKQVEDGEIRMDAGRIIL